MADHSQSGGTAVDALVGEVTPPNDADNGAAPSKPPPRKRRRVVISCLDCHKRKQKCDRQLPCANCVSRGKANTCRYETGTPLVRDQHRKGSAHSSSNSHEPSPPEHHAAHDALPIKPVDFGYSNTGAGASTLGFIKKIEGVGGSGEQPMPTVGSDAQDGEHFGSRERYKSLVRHLPARTFVEKLVAIYMKEFNWMYYGFCEAEFMEQLDQWYQLPFHLLSNAGPQGIEPTLRSFPALVFQILASALLTIPDEDDENFVSLKYAGNMTFEDLASEYSETGVAILSLLGKRQMTVSTVLAGWVRAAFLKFTGQVTEAWHQVGTSIRDAQEIGLHRDQFDPQPSANSNTEAALEAMWSAQTRRRIWYILVSWDLHTGAVLGRPTSVDFRVLRRTEPVDAPIPKDRRKTPVFPRSEQDPPTPLTRSLWAFEAMRPLRDILDLEKEGPFPKDFSRVTKLHQELLDLQERTPPYFRLENPDTQFDHLPECWWLPLVRPALPQLISFNLMALHRPYIFTRASSRHEALKASLDMLEAQRSQFRALDPQQYKTFSLFFGTFDAIVMMASIYILFPKEHPDLLADALQHFSWGVERFEAMADRNRLAAAALGVLNAIYIRLKKAMGCGFLVSRFWPPNFKCPNQGPDQCPHRYPQAPGNGTGAANTTTGSETSPDAEPSERSSSNQQHPSIPSASASASASGSSVPADQGTGTNTLSSGLTPGADMFATPDWSFPTDFDFSSLPPMYPMGDVAYNDLTGIRDDGYTTTAMTGGALAAGGQWPGTTAADGMSTMGAVAGMGGLDGQGNPEEVPWAFGGEFGNDTIWNLLNQFPPH
ncbi:uncharacterized protein JN550_012541 [Neoarthrinium moseri]|uniref:uncharacterized protein n=1 Tax=Neoarthrinium moseri TaxID=1658444 RepID=UPI001FDDC62E|nr:uncharacterized protein JN550_012541 [Neoarthrinium moseri]KAI1858709.1 hypothetical protein JN550_012541 [Neoarthrinium moseri]